MTDWQDELFDDDAYCRLIESAGLPHAKIRYSACHIAIKSLANRAVHRSFEATLETRTADRVFRWASRTEGPAKRRLEEAILRARPFGGYQVPPADFRNGEALKEWINAEAEGRAISPPKAGRPDTPFTDEMFECLLKCFHEIYRENPYKYKQEAARFIARFYVEVEEAFARLGISDPERRGRTSKWKPLTACWLQTKIAQYPKTSAHLDWKMTDEGQFFRSDGWLKKHAAGPRDVDKQH